MYPSSSITTVNALIQKASEDRQRHWARITRCAPHERPHRRERIFRLTNELYDLYAEKRRLGAGL